MKNKTEARENKESFDEGNKILQEYVESAKERLDILAKTSDNIIGIIASVDSQNGATGQTLSFLSNVSLKEVVKTFARLGNKNEIFRDAITMTAKYFELHPEDQEKEESKNSILELLKNILKNGTPEISAGGVFAVKDGEIELVDFEGDSEEKEQMKQILQTLSGVAKKTKKAVKEKPAVKKTEKKKVSMKKLLGKKK